MAPEYLAHGQLTEKADVFSFGVLLPEVVTEWQTTEVKLYRQLNVYCFLFAVLGAVLFIPGFYYTRLAYYAYKGMVVEGVVCKKNVAHRWKTSRIEKPWILILRGALKYQRVSNLLSSFDTLLNQVF